MDNYLGNTLKPNMASTIANFDILITNKIETKLADGNLSS